MAGYHSRPLYNFGCFSQVSNFCSGQFPRGTAGSHRSPKRSRGTSFNLRRNPRLTFFKCYRQSRRSPSPITLSDFCYPQEVRGSLCNLQSEEDKYVHFSSTFLDGDPQSNPSGTSQLRLGGFHRPQRCLPSCANSPPVKAFSGVQVSGQELHLQGPPFRPKGLSVGLFKSRGICHRSLTPLGRKDFLLPRRLVTGRRVSGSPGVSFADHSGTVSEVGFHHQLEEVDAHTTANAYVPRSLLRYSQVDSSSGRAQGGALQSLLQKLTAHWVAPALLWQRFLGHLASFVDLVPNCRLLIRPLQLHLLRFFTPLSDPQSKLIPLTREIKNLCVAWASPVRLLGGNPFSPPPHSLVLTSDASRLGWGAVLPPHRVSGVWSEEESLDHINSLELRAVFLALKSLEVHVRGHSLMIH